MSRRHHTHEQPIPPIDPNVLLDCPLTSDILDHSGYGAEAVFTPVTTYNPAIDINEDGILIYGDFNKNTLGSGNLVYFLTDEQQAILQSVDSDKIKLTCTVTPIQYTSGQYGTSIRVDPYGNSTQEIIGMYNVNNIWYSPVGGTYDMIYHYIKSSNTLYRGNLTNNNIATTHRGANLVYIIPTNSIRIGAKSNNGNYGKFRIKNLKITINE